MGISISMVAATVFFLMESTAVSGHWKTSMNVGALVTLVAAVHYFYMREFWKLMIGTVVMLVFGYTGEAHLCPGGAWVGFAGGMSGWFFILFEIFGGEAGSVAGELGSANKYVASSFSTMRLIVTAGWSIYPAGYFFGYLMGGVNDCSLNLIYNLADFVNKIAFCLAIWQAAKNESLSGA